MFHYFVVIPSKILCYEISFQLISRRIINSSKQLTLVYLRRSPSVEISCYQWIYVEQFMNLGHLYDARPYDRML